MSTLGPSGPKELPVPRVIAAAVAYTPQQQLHGMCKGMSVAVAQLLSESVEVLPAAAARIATANLAVQNKDFCLVDRRTCMDQEHPN